MGNGQWYPPEWPDRIRALAAGTLVPAEPRRAATVMLLRDVKAAEGPEGVEVHMLRRRTSMAFAAGAYAYPGGGVDPRDDDRQVRWAGPAREEWAARLGVPDREAQAIVCAAVRETFEEAGVLLAGPTPDTVVDDTTGADWVADRQALIARDLSFAAFLERRGLVLRSDLLGAWARWITPEFEPRRYDTWFFVAALPAGQRTSDDSSEADRAVWIRPERAASRYDRGELTMMPPTIATLRTLAAYGSVDSALAGSTERDLTPVLARARLVDGELVLSWPGHDEFTKHLPPAGGSSAAEPDAGAAEPTSSDSALPRPETSRSEASRSEASRSEASRSEASHPDDADPTAPNPQTDGAR